jgi:fatty acid synthase
VTVVSFLLIEPTKNFAIPWALFALANDLGVMSDLSSRSFGPFCDESTWIRILDDAGFQIVAQKSDGLLNTVFLGRISTKALVPSCPSSIDIDEPSFKWFEQVKSAMASEQSSFSKPVWLDVAEQFK